jgi:hypothetical protein
MHLRRLYDQDFVTYISQMLNESLTDITSVFKFSPYFVKQVKGNCNHCSSYPPSKFWQSGQVTGQPISLETCNLRSPSLSCGSGGTPSHWNSMTMGPLLPRQAWGIPPTCLSTLCHSMYVHHRKKAQTLSVWARHKTRSTSESPS